MQQGRGGAVHRSRALVTLAAVIFLEAAMVTLLAAFLVYELITEVPLSVGSALFMIVLVALAAGWLYVIGVGILHAKPWVRSAALTWQILQIAVAIGSFQGLFARTDIGWILLLPALVVIILLFTKSVITATARE